MNINWDEAPEWADRVVEGSISGLGYWANDDQRVKIGATSAWIDKVHIEENWRVLATRPYEKKWNGKGLPPVGTLCEAKCTARGKERDWFKAEVKYLSPFTTVLDDFTSGELAGEFLAHPDTVQFRPIKTKEQLAAEEREKAVEEMFARFGGPGGLTRKQCIWVISEGYRKQENNDAKG